MGRRATAAARGVAILVAAAAMLVDPRAATGDGSSPSLIAKGRALYLTGCQSCHGTEASGVPGVAPTLQGVGASAADFVLTTGRMPLPAPDQQPVRRTPAYTPAEIDALVAYVGSLGGPPVPGVSLAGTDLSRHQALGRGGVVTGASVPDLASASPRQIAEAVRLGPYLMPAFGPRAVDDRTLADIIRYVIWARSPHDPGGAALGHAGPVSEGMAAWLGGLFALVVFARLVGKRWQP